MGWADRPYYGDSGGGFGGGGGQMRLAFPQLTPAVKWLLIINAAAFFIDELFFQGRLSNNLFALSLVDIKRGMIWQLGTYMFMHAGIGHIVLNMLGVFFFGTLFERTHGSKRFLWYYFICGIVGGIVYLVVAAAGLIPAGMPIVGASGAVYGLIISAVILYPRMQVIFIIFPMPMRVLGIIVFGMILWNLLDGGENWGGDLCHLAGAVAGVATMYAWGMIPGMKGPQVASSVRQKVKEGAWQKRMQTMQAEQEEVDRILAKVHEQGINSLTSREKKTLQRATRRQRNEEQRKDRETRQL